MENLQDDVIGNHLTINIELNSYLIYRNNGVKRLHNVFARHLHLNDKLSLAYKVKAKISIDGFSLYPSERQMLLFTSLFFAFILYYDITLTIFLRKNHPLKFNFMFKEKHFYNFNIAFNFQ